MRVLVTRPEREARKLAGMLEAAGHQVCLSPVLEIRGTGVAIPAGKRDALVATSAHAFGFLEVGDPKVAAALRALQIFLVGERTAEAAQRSGFPKPDIIEREAASLAEAMISRLPKGARLIYLTGVDRKPGLEEALRAHGFALEAVEIYCAAAALALSADAVEKMRSGVLEAVLHFSRRSAEIFVNLAVAAGLGQEARALRHVCLSSDVAEGLALLHVLTAVWPPRPDVGEMLQLLEPGVG